MSLRRIAEQVPETVYQVFMKFPIFHGRGVTKIVVLRGIIWERLDFDKHQ